MLSAVVSANSQSVYLYKSGSPTVTVLEYSLAGGATSLVTKGDGGRFSLTADLSALTEGDLYEIRLYEKGLVTGTKGLLAVWEAAGPGGGIAILPSIGQIALRSGWDWTILKRSGTDRVIPYSIWAREFSPGAGQAGMEEAWATGVFSYEALFEEVAIGISSYEALMPEGSPPGGLVDIGSRRRRRPHRVI